MSKEDIEDAPERVPTKRGAIWTVPDKWLAQWLSRDNLTEHERGRVLAERTRRRQQRPEKPVGILIGHEGITPTQLARLTDTLLALDPTAIHHPGVAGKVQALMRRQSAPVHEHRGELAAVVRSSSVVVACPRAPDPKSPVMEAERLARHRKLKVIVLPPGG